MKVIELLNKIANGEDLPEKIRYEENIWKLNPINDTYDNGECCLFEDYIDKKYVITDVLNDEVEVIEEDKKIPTLKSLNLTKIDINKRGQVYGVTKEEMIADIQTLQNWINKIIDKINKE